MLHGGVAEGTKAAPLEGAVPPGTCGFEPRLHRLTKKNGRGVLDRRALAVNRAPGHRLEGYHAMTIAKGNARTCLDCKVLPPDSVLLCDLHAAAEDMRDALRDAQTILETIQSAAIVGRSLTENELIAATEAANTARRTLRKATR